MEIKPTSHKNQISPDDETLVGFARSGDLFCTSLHHSHTQRNNLMVIGSASSWGETAGQAIRRVNPAVPGFLHTPTQIPFFALPRHSCNCGGIYAQKTTKTEHRRDSVCEMLEISRSGGRYRHAGSLRQQAIRPVQSHNRDQASVAAVGRIAGVLAVEVAQE